MFRSARAQVPRLPKNAYSPGGCLTRFAQTHASPYPFSHGIFLTARANSPVAERITSVIEEQLVLSRVFGVCPWRGLANRVIPSAIQL